MLQVDKLDHGCIVDDLTAIVSWSSSSSISCGSMLIRCKFKESCVPALIACAPTIVYMQWHITETLSTDNELHWQLQANITRDLGNIIMA